MNTAIINVLRFIATLKCADHALDMAFQTYDAEEAWFDRADSYFAALNRIEGAAQAMGYIEPTGWEDRGTW